MPIIYRDSAQIAQDIKLLDVIKFDTLERCPDGYQSENVSFDKDTVKVISHIEHKSCSLDNLTHDYYNLFGNHGKAVHVDDIGGVDHSLVFIKVDEYDIFIKSDNNQLRINFEYNNTYYDLPVTDIDFSSEYRNNPNFTNSTDCLYLTISLAVFHNNFHSKLIAGVICI